jgi:two-component system sensor histidine kinase/response regulator
VNTEMKNNLDEKTPSVLVVDDMAENIDILAGALTGDYEVKVALNGESALDIAFAKPHPDIILLDIMMPGMDGYEVCERLQKNESTRDIPVIFVTAMGEMDDETRGFRAGGVDYITKPVRIPIVLARVKAHLELKMARESLKNKNLILKENLQLRDDVDSIIRHDLKTPLNVIMWVPDLLKFDDNLTESQLETLSILKQASRSMIKIMNSSINLIKMERGEYQVDASPVNVLKTLSQIQNEMKGIIRARHLIMEFRINDEDCHESDQFKISGEEILFYTIFINLIKNAIEASPEGGRVMISLDNTTDLTVQINNQGAVPDVICDRFFDKYVTAGKSSGTGLGTYSARLITETMNGAIQMETSLEKGTTITVSFPKEQQC